jgi:hypothetical protein
MACKTAIRVLANLLPQISEEEAVASVLASDERGEMGEQTPAMDMDLAPVPALSEPAQPEADTAQVTNWAADAEEKPQQGPEPPTKRRGRPKRSAPQAEETAKAPEVQEPAPAASSEAEENFPEPEPQEPFGGDGLFGEPEPEDTGLEQLKRRLQS